MVLPRRVACDLIQRSAFDRRETGQEAGGVVETRLFGIGGGHEGLRRQRCRGFTRGRFARWSLAHRRFALRLIAEDEELGLSGRSHGRNEDDREAYQALQWMRSAGERGHAQAQLALGRSYLSGLQEMGADPAEAERWLSMAAGRGDKEAGKLLAEASAARTKNQDEYKAWLDLKRQVELESWQSRYTYYWVWQPTGWSSRY